jgi:hypothetical protein
MLLGLAKAMLWAIVHEKLLLTAMSMVTVVADVRAVIAPLWALSQVVAEAVLTVPVRVTVSAEAPTARALPDRLSTALVFNVLI